MRQHRFIYNRFIYNIVTLALVILLSVLAGSCGRKSQMLRTLEAAEQLMDERADSALAILDTIDPVHLRTDQEHALYGLLYTQALAKNRLPMPPDTLISRSAAYFNDKGDRERYAKANFYQGHLYYKKEDYPQAILCFFKAKESAEEDSLFLWAGLGCRGMADVYEEYQNFADMKVYAEKELTYMKKSGKKVYADNAVLDLARALCYTEEYDRSNQLLINFLKFEANKDEYSVICIAQGIIATNFMHQQKFDEALPWLQKITSGPKATPDDSLRLAYTLVGCGKITEAQDILSRVSTGSPGIRHLAEISIHATTGNYKDAYMEYNDMANRGDTLRRSLLHHEISNTLNDYYTYSRDIQKLKHQKNTVILFLSLLIIVLVSIIVVYMFARSNIALKSLIKDNDSVIEGLKKKLSIRTKRKEKSLNLPDEFMVNLTILNKYGELVFAKKDNEAAVKIILSQIKKVLDSYESIDKVLQDIEKGINTRTGNIVDRLKKDLPNLKDKDLYLFSLSAAKVVPYTICVLLGEEDVDAVYSRKKRLKAKIRQLPRESAELYLAYL